MLKRAFDLTLSLLLLIILTPLITIAGLLILLMMGRPVIFKQLRPGLHEKPFYLFKFRTMEDLRDTTSGDLLPDDERLTVLGSKLRKYSLDELPQLINVVSGDLSFVGPRPLLMQYLERYSPEQARRHDVKPGITGWAQVNGRNAISWEEKFEHDVWYVDNQTLWLDLRILWLTVIKVLRAEGISGEGSATMSEFMGEKK
jgi:sugar transferase EpsL